VGKVFGNIDLSRAALSTGRQTLGVLVSMEDFGGLTDQSDNPLGAGRNTAPATDTAVGIEYR
jgi:hypothetical protein